MAVRKFTDKDTSQIWTLLNEIVDGINPALQTDQADRFYGTEQMISGAVPPAGTPKLVWESKVSNYTIAGGADLPFRGFSFPNGVASIQVQSVSGCELMTITSVALDMVRVACWNFTPTPSLLGSNIAVGAAIRVVGW